MQQRCVICDRYVVMMLVKLNKNSNIVLVFLYLQNIAWPVLLNGKSKSRWKEWLPEYTAFSRIF